MDRLALAHAACFVIATPLPHHRMRAAKVLTFLCGVVAAEVSLHAIPQRVSAEGLLRKQAIWCPEHAMELVTRDLEPTASEFAPVGELDSYVLGRGLHDATGGMLTRTMLPEPSQRSLPRSDRDESLHERVRREERRIRLGEPPWLRERFRVVGMFADGGALTVIGRDHDLPACPERSLAYYESLRGGSVDARREQTALEVLRQHEMSRRDRLAGIWSAILAESQTTAPTAASAYAIVDDSVYVLPAGSDAVFDAAIASGREQQQRHMAEIQRLLGLEPAETGR